MDLIKKTTILFPPDMYGQLARLAQQRNTSVGELVREACRSQYSLTSREDRLAIIDRIAALQLPVGTPQRMKRESVPLAKNLP